MTSLDLPPQAALKFSQPPSSNAVGPTIEWLKTAISTLYRAARTSQSQDKPPVLARSAYLNLYSTVHEYCEVTKTARHSPNSDYLYYFLRDQIKTYCPEIRALLDTPEDAAEVNGAHDTVEKYVAQYHKLTLLAGLVSNIMRRLDRTHIQHMIWEKRQDWYHIKDLHNVVWKNEILQLDGDSTEADTGSKVAKALATLQTQIGDETGSDKELVDRFLETPKALDEKRKDQGSTLEAFNAKACRQHRCSAALSPETRSLGQVRIVRSVISGSSAWPQRDSKDKNSTAH